MSLPTFRNLLIALSILSVSNQALAASNYAEAYIDWDNLQFNFIDINNGFMPILNPGLFSNEETENVAYLEDEFFLLDFDFDSSPDWTSDTQASINFTNPDITTAIATAAATALELTSYAELTSNTEALIESDVVRTGLFTAATDGLMVINAPFTLIAEVMDANQYQAYAEVGFSLTIAGSGSTDDIESFSSVFTTDTILSSDNTGTLAIAIPFEDGDVVSISAFTYAAVTSANPIPIPATVWLLGSGLVMLMVRKPFA